jgi:hypothetical protein
MLFEDVKLPFVLGPAFVVVGLAVAIASARIDSQATALTKEVKRLQQITFATGVMLVLLVLLLPTTPSLSTFGLPKTPSDLDSPERVLRYLQTYNKALTRTIDVTFWALFVFVWWFLAAVYSVSRVATVVNRQGPK